MPCDDIIKHIQEDAERRRRKQEENPIAVPNWPKKEPAKVPDEVGKEKVK